MKYKIITFESVIGLEKHIIILRVDNSIESFSVNTNNSRYEQFIQEIKLTDKQVHALEPDIWYDFPE